MANEDMALKKGISVFERGECSKSRRTQKVEGSTSAGGDAMRDGRHSTSQFLGAKEEVPPESDQNSEALLAVPESFREKFVRMSGKNLTLVMEKILTETDLCPRKRRLLISKCGHEFLNDEEIALLKLKGEDKKRRNEIETHFFDTKGKRFLVPIRLQRDGYVITDPWVDIAANRSNKLAAGICIELWAFRGGNTDVLCLAIVNKGSVEPPKERSIKKNFFKGCFSGGSSSSRSA